MAIMAWVLPILLLLSSSAAVEADQFGDFAFTSNGTSVTITGYSGSGGAVVIPATINGLPVVSIGDYAFNYSFGLTSVTIPYGVTSIGNHAFSRCTELTSVTLSNSVTSIGDSTFYGCSGLTGVTIPNSVTSIGSNAFEGCYRMTSVTISNSVTSIGNGTFLSCGLTSVTIPNSVTSIGNGAFQSCSGLTSVTIPYGVISIGSGAFGNCYNLTAITIDPLNPTYSSLDGVLFDKSQTMLIQCPGGKAGTYTIPGNVTSIGVGALAACRGLTSVTIPASVTGIGDYAFNSCPKMTAISVDPLNSTYSSLDGVLFNKSQTTLIAYPGGKAGSYTIPDSVTSIGNNAFSDCDDLTSVTIPASVTSIGNGAFSNCDDLTSVTIPASVTSIGYSAFSGCTGLTSATFLGNAPTIEWGGLLFQGTPSGFIVFYPVGGTGFTTPTWNGYPSAITGDSPPSVTSSTVTYVTATTATLGGNVISTGGSAISARGVVYAPTATSSNPQIGDAGVTNVTSAGTTGDFSVTAGGLAQDTAYTFKAYATNTAGTSYSATGTFTTLPLFTSSISGGAVTITGYNGPGGGDVVIPGMIGGLPVTSIGDYAFSSYSYGLTSVTIPKSVTYISNTAFYNCGNLLNIIVDPLNLVYSSVDGVLFNKSLTALIAYPGGRAGSYAIPNSVTNIGNYAFSSCSGLTSLTIPNSVTTIGYSAFTGCDGLTSVAIPSSVTTIGDYSFQSCTNLSSAAMEVGLITIGRWAFWGCSKLVTITIPDSVISIGEQAFQGCTSLVGATIGNSVTTIGSHTFGGSGLTSVTIPASVTTIGQAAFGSCPYLTSIIVDGLNSTYMSEDGVLFNKGKTTLFQCPGGKVGDYTIPSSVTNIGILSFYGCTRLTGVTIPNSVSTISSEAFERCRILNKVSIPSSVTSIGNYAFSSCSAMTAALFLGNAPTMGTNVFDGTASGFKVYYLNGSIGFTSPSWKGYQSAVAGPPSVTTPTFASVTDATARLGGNVTGDGGYTISARGVVYAPTVNNNNPRIGGAGVTNVTGTGTTGIFTVNASALMPGTAYTFAAYATNSKGTGYSVTRAFTTVQSPFTYSTSASAVTITGYSGFGGAVVIPGMIGGLPVTSIGDNAFFGKSSLTSVTIPSSVISIGNSAFWGCANMTTITVDQLNPTYSSLDGVLFNKSQTTLILFPGGKAGTYAIPTSVTSIGSRAFGNCAGLTSVTIPASVISIGSYALSYCSGLTTFTVDPLSSTYSSLNGVLFNKSQTTLITYPGGKAGSYAIPNSVTSIGDVAFYHCTGLTSVTIPNTVISIGWNAFWGCTGLASVTIPNSVTSIGVDAFMYCEGLTGVTIGNNVTSIGIYAFYGCTGLTSVTIPNSVTSIGDSAFYGCSSLTSTTFLGVAPTIGSDVFSGTASGFRVYYLSGSMGFSTPTWNGYPSAITGANVTTPTFASVTDATATLGGTVTSDGGYTITTRGVVYAPTAANNNPRIGGAGVTNVIGTGTTGVFTVNANGLMPGTEYTFSAYATTNLGTSYSATGTFTTLASPFTFSISGGVVEITGYTGPGGSVVIPGMIGGLPVTSIGDGAFMDCTGLTGVTIPDSVTSIGSWAFYDCSGLTSVTIPNSVTSIGDSTFDSCTGLTSVTIPNNVTSIGYGAFFNCSGLSSVTIPASVTRIGDWAFYYCRGLAATRYMGNAPTMGRNVFVGTGSGFTVYHFDGATGFTSPPWTGYTLVNMGAPTPVSTWLVENTLPPDLNLQDDPNGDGVSLLMAYALDLNPNENLSGSLPEPVVEAGQMSLDFHSGSGGVTYAVETSTDMLNWTTEGVAISAPDANQVRTATVDMNGSHRYMRLVVVH